LVSYERYLLNEAWLWEHQAIVRARAITDSKILAERFMDIRNGVLSLARDTGKVKVSIVEMRDKMLSNDNQQAKSEFNIKNSKGGVIDIEFMVQYLVLTYARSHPDITQHTDNVRILESCATAGLLDASIAQELKEIYLKYRMHLHRLSLHVALCKIIGQVCYTPMRLNLQFSNLNYKFFPIKIWS